MLNPATLRGRLLYRRVNYFRDFATSFITDRRRRAIVAANLSTEVPQGEDNIGKNWQEYMFESMPSIAAVTMLSKLQSDIRKAQGEVLHTLAANIGVKDIRVNELNAYVLPEATTLFPGDEFRSRVFMAAIDTTQRPVGASVPTVATTSVSARPEATTSAVISPCPTRPVRWFVANSHNIILSSPRPPVQQWPPI